MRNIGKNMVVGAVLLMPAMLGNTCGEVVRNPDFELWCGEALCDWRVDSGSIARAPTWHQEDFGAEMIGDPAQISQLSGIKTTCLQLDMLTHVESGTEVIFEMDFRDDGSSEFSLPISAERWKPLRFKIAPPTWYDQVRFLVKKRGGGRAVLARIAVTASDQCLTDPLALNDRPNGATCANPSECGSGHCVDRVGEVGGMGLRCGACIPGAGGCGAGEVCGYDLQTRHLATTACVPAGRGVLGERCLSDAECGGGVCCEGFCSECCAGRAECSRGGAQCIRRPAASIGESSDWDMYIVLPRQCDPGRGEGARGAPCLSNSDCASAACAGGERLRRCLEDGRVCTRKEDCFFSCADYGVAGGTCQ